MSKRMSKS